MVIAMRRNGWRNLLLCMGLVVLGMTGCGTAQDSGPVEENQESGLPEEDSGTDENSAQMQDESKETADASGQNSEADVSGQMEEAEEESIVLEGMSLSILGDSISTFEGWIPAECTIFFPRDGEVTDVSQTWWMKLLDETGMELCTNNSSAGSTCSGDSLSADDPAYACSGGRLSLLMGPQGKMPDIIIVYMGINDLLKGIPLGDNDGLQLVEEGKIENFSDAYCLILDKLASDFPIAQVYCCSLTPVGDWGIDQPFVVFENHLGLTAEDYSERIHVIAENKGIPVIDLSHCGIEIDNLQEMTSDGVHLTPDGMECVKTAVLAGLSGGGN